MNRHCRLALFLSLAAFATPAALGQCTALPTGCPGSSLTPVCETAPTVGNQQFRVRIQVNPGITLIGYGLPANPILPTCGPLSSCGTWIDLTAPAKLYLLHIHDLPVEILWPVSIPIPNLPSLVGVSFVVQSAAGPSCRWNQAMLVTIQ